MGDTQQLFAIESNVPLPGSSGGGRPRRYPFGDLGPGESFSVAVTTFPSPRAALNSVSSQASRYTRAHPGIRFRCATERAGEPLAAIRVWRIA